MNRVTKLMCCLGASAAMTAGIASVAEGTPAETQATAGIISCGPCSGPFFLNGQICFMYSCNGGPCDLILCLNF